MFTFLTLSFEQEKYIIQHLESIKYQMMHYGADIKAAYILADDASTDRTVEWARLWLEKNKDIFSDITILENKENKGIVYNYLRGINAIKNREKMKYLAADDLYYNRNIFNVLRENDVVLTPVICFDDAYDIVKNRYYIYKSCLDMEKGRLKEKIRYGLDYQNKIQAPGGFVDLSLLQDEGLQGFLRQYTWIEDYPQWYYIFNRCGKNIRVDIDLNPYVLYRVSSGISLNKDHSKRNIFQEEEERFMEMVKKKRKKPIFPYGYFLDMCKTEYLDSYLNPVLRKFKKEMRKEAEGARLFLQKLCEKDREFRSKYI